MNFVCLPLVLLVLGYSPVAYIVKAADADVIIRSIDAGVFRLHKKYLEYGTGAFPPAETPTNDEVVELSEDSKTLDILFRFVYPHRYPDLDELCFDELLLLAEAAEKYEVYAASNACKYQFRSFFTA